MNLLKKSIVVNRLKDQNVEQINAILPLFVKRKPFSCDRINELYKYKEKKKLVF